ncbi:unnamed protein product [Mycena citricolor]|uniref:NADH:flavin oxidoreductase/NADH oxidase N-terminal domain-containing protein n=1 Tax=Mycena citricolor TaxID=2018698 RepID=A0AAD2H5Y7_9AGAR|nr:unnamed protein product [Mycena citricolor]
MTSTPKLFQPIVVGEMQLKHRVVMAPLTRFRVDDNHVPLSHVKEYYSQRGSVEGTLLVTGACYIDARAVGVPNVPGIWSEAQIAAWKEVTEAVHAKGSFIYLQLWALGRAAHPAALGENPYVSASDIPLSDRPADEIKPRPLTKAEISEYVRLFARAAVNAVEKAGFDGVELHGANGYLIDQFLQDVSNARSDEYGGSVKNRARFALEIMDAVVAAVGQKKSAIRLSPWNVFNGEVSIRHMSMKNPKPTFSYLVKQLKARHPELAYIHAVEPRAKGFEVLDDSSLPEGMSNDFIRDIWTSPDSARRLISAGGYSQEAAIKDGERDELVAFGRQFISNPDLPARLLHDYPLNPYDRTTFYTTGTLDPKGYTDYPFYDSKSPL